MNLKLNLSKNTKYYVKGGKLVLKFAENLMAMEVSAINQLIPFLIQKMNWNSMIVYKTWPNG